ncbi:succinyl-diaminopimelate desuccinylase [Buchnera aphidicola]|uniref:Succinyl-diaminopimelate desuccinylase n=1 Tax=Buchnera aphidicola (Cinara strobi) TaxID=1921549 RepID=A0A3B1E024_9GAMM|nr:succinyl-diaminopimelate desuccinylase [Buchnera aphidicola]VAX76295.1 Succinyl-diaminopimelate desuccinylase [Buchnera aphidicola (Cinara strobi)]
MYTTVLNLTQELINIPSISPSDLGCQEILINRLKSNGFFIERMNFKDTKNFWAWRGVGRTITFVGHTDVVPAGNKNNWNTPPFTSTISNGMLFGRGAVDMKGSIAAMFIAVENFIKQKPNYKGRISFLITSDEESSGKNGTKKIVSILKKRKENIDYCLVGEPTSEKKLGDCIKVGRRGSISADLTIYGKQGHVAYPNKVINPIHSALPFLLDLSSFSFGYEDDFFDPVTIQISKICSGANYTSNMVPGELQVSFNIRFGSSVTDKEIIDIVQKILFKYSFKYLISWKLHAKPFFSIPRKLCSVLTQSIYKNVNIRPTQKTNGGTSDGRFFFNWAKEIAEFGLLNLTIHQENECVNILDLFRLQKIYYDILNKLFYK